MTKKKYRLFIDDERWPVEPDWVIARTPLQAIQAFEHYGIPTEIAFDFDLGTDSAGQKLEAIEFVNYLWNLAEEGKLLFPQDFKYYIHSQNPIGAARIQSKMDQMLHYYSETS